MPEEEEKYLLWEYEITDPNTNVQVTLDQSYNDTVSNLVNAPNSLFYLRYSTSGKLTLIYGLTTLTSGDAIFNASTTKPAVSWCCDDPPW